MPDPQFGCHPRSDLPDAVTVYEVGLRDGLQNEPAVVPTDVKVAMAARLAATGLRWIEATSFVRPDRVPQLADAELLLTELPMEGPVAYPVLVANERGLDRALAAGARHVAVFASATETFSERNLGCSMAEASRRIAAVAAGARAAGVPVRGYLSMCFGDPWEGPVAFEAVRRGVDDLVAAGCAQVSLGDTIGVATAGHVRDLLAVVVDDGIGIDRVALHVHDTYGQALANVLAALECGITTFDASAGGLGGCPFAGAASGNLATEDLLWMLDGLGIASGVDIGALAGASRWLAEHLGRPSPSRVVAALDAFRPRPTAPGAAPPAAPGALPPATPRAADHRDPRRGAHRG